MEKYMETDYEHTWNTQLMASVRVYVVINTYFVLVTLYALL